MRVALVLPIALSLVAVASAQETKRTKLERVMGSYVGKQEDAILALALARDGKRALTSSGNEALLWDLATGDVAVLSSHASPVHAVALSHDETRALTGDETGVTKLWDLTESRPREITKLRAHEKCIAQVWFTKDGRAVTASFDGTARVWDLASGRVIHELRHGSPVRALALSPDGRHALTGATPPWDSKDPADARLWDLETGAEVRKLEGHKRSINGLAFLADGKRALSGGDDGKLFLSDLATGHLLQFIPSRR